MRAIVIILLVIGVVFVGFVLFWPQEPATNNRSGCRPDAPEWLAFFVPRPPAAIPFASTPPQSAIAAGGSWEGKFTAQDRELGVVRVRLVNGSAVTVTATEPGEERQVLKIVTAGNRTEGCGDDITADGDEGSVVVHKGIATIRIEAPAGAVTIAVNE